jgi:cytochrome c oxidase subunit II
MQDIAWYASIVPVFLVMLSFLFVFAGSRQPAQVAPAAQERLRRSLFLGFIVLGVPLAVHSMAELPYRKPAEWGGPVQKIDAVGRQWAWTLSTQSVKAGDPVEFHVTSADVNHGFAIYDKSMRVIAQTQAMPGYTNILRHVFKDPGVYTILCLEYCGIAHHSMSAELRVLP